MDFDVPAGGLALFFLLGLRHGVEPDHIAAVDGLTLRAIDRQESHAAWTGSFFALGHGLAVTALTVSIGLFAHAYTVPEALRELADWLPIGLLLLLGAWNLRALLAPGDYRPSSVRMHLIPPSLRERTDIVSTIAIGLLFALVIDTVAHISAWSVFATGHGSVGAGLLAGVLFSGGMAIGTTANSQLVSRMLRGGHGTLQASRWRRRVGWFVVLLSFGAAAFAIVDKLGVGNAN